MGLSHREYIHNDIWNLPSLRYMVLNVKTTGVSVSYTTKDLLESAIGIDNAQNVESQGPINTAYGKGL